MFPLGLIDQHIADGDKDLFELIPDGIFQLELSGALIGLNPFVIGQVDGDCFASGVAITGIINNIISTQV